MKPIKILIHATDVSYKTNPDQFVQTNNYHQSQDFPVSSKGLYVGYHSLISNGVEYICKDDTEIGAHCNSSFNGVSLNMQSLGVCVAFDGDVELMKDADYKLLQKRVWAWQDKWNISNENVQFHRDFSYNGKTCPGILITKDWLIGLLKRPQTVPTASCVLEKGIIADQQKKIEWYMALVSQLRKLIG